MIGGTSQAYKMTEKITRQLARQLLALSGNGYSLMVTASRRTGHENSQILKESLEGTGIYFWDGQGNNPYFGFLAWADFILVTADSVSMLSEAASTGKPVYMVPLEGGSERLEKFHSNLLTREIIRKFDGSLEPYSYTPLDDAATIADEIKSRCHFS
jgi:mitochondrial fission protein ELM1